jgi:hypothetical protein
MNSQAILGHEHGDVKEFSGSSLYFILFNLLNPSGNFTYQQV